MSQAQQPNQINIMNEKVGEGTYANFFVVTNSASEFVIDFGRMLPGIPDAKYIYTRVITTPQHAKQLLNILEKNIESFEKQNGEIKVQGMPDNKPVGFKPDKTN